MCPVDLSKVADAVGHALDPTLSQLGLPSLEGHGGSPQVLCEQCNLRQMLLMIFL